MTKTPKTAAVTSTKKLPHKTYTVRGQRRALFTLGTGEGSKLMDVPAALLDIAASGQPTPDSYLVEEGLRQRDPTGELDALLADYLAVAKRHQAIPMTVFAMTPELRAHAARRTHSTLPIHPNPHPRPCPTQLSPTPPTATTE